MSELEQLSATDTGNEITSPFQKKVMTVLVEFAETKGVMQTLEGPVNYAAGDALMTGIAGERWPIRRMRFEETYEPVDRTTLMGEPGPYLKKPMTVLAYQVTNETRVSLAGDQGDLVAKPGDWVLRAPDGHRWVVANDIFANSYESAC